MIADLAMMALGLAVAAGLAYIGVIVASFGPCPCASCAIERMDRTPAPVDVVSR